MGVSLYDTADYSIRIALIPVDTSIVFTNNPEVIETICVVFAKGNS